MTLYFAQKQAHVVPWVYSEAGGKPSRDASQKAELSPGQIESYAKGITESVQLAVPLTAP
jgi:hypothetical protein